VNDIQQWLTEGQQWLGKLQMVGLASAGPMLVRQGQQWCQQAEWLGWPETSQLAQTLMDTNLPADQRAEALLNLSVWLSSAQRLLEATGDQL
jgi:hypothetical protein